MDTYTLFTHQSDNFIAHLIMWGSLAFMSGLILYWAATIENDIENNPDEKK